MTLIQTIPTTMRFMKMLANCRIFVFSDVVDFSFLSFFNFFLSYNVIKQRFVASVYRENQKANQNLFVSDIMS